jgi:Fe-S-cluster containining protein
MAIYFKCQRCGACCRIAGQVRVTDSDIMRLATFLELSEPEFIQRYTELARDRRGLVLKDQPDGVCLFLEASDCRVYPVKPEQCTQFPHTWNNPGWERLCRAASISVGPSPPADPGPPA